MKRCFVLLSCLMLVSLSAEESVNAIYKSLDPKSISQNLAFYELYPQTQEGRKALIHALELLKYTDNNQKYPLILPKIDVQLMISLVNKNILPTAETLSDEQLKFLESLSKNLSHNQLKGHSVWTEEDMVALPPNEIDLARALFIAELGSTNEARNKIRYYEACIDLMALQVLAALKENATDLEKIYAINDFIFYKMKFKFPPHSIYAKNIDTYTFLPSVIDNRRGVCLGVSTLYLCLAQRLNLDLDIITPPGHIFVSYNNNGDIINIETTARGINLPSEVYLSVETKKLQKRNIKEVVGMAFVNQASLSWMQENYEKTVDLYLKALQYMPNDPLTEELLGYNYLFLEKTAEGKALLKKYKDYIPDYAVSKDTMAEDYLNNNIDAEGIKTIFLPVDDSRKSILEKQKKMQEILKKYPRFRAGQMQLASTYLQLGRTKEALEILKTCYALDKNEPVINYYMSVIYYERLDYKNSWKHLKITKDILNKSAHTPRAIEEFENVLSRDCPEPLTL